MNSISPWAASAGKTLSEDQVAHLFTHHADLFTFNAVISDDSLWIIADWPNGGRVAFRIAYCPGAELEVDKMEHGEDGLLFHLSCSMGKYRSKVVFPADENGTLRYTTTLKPAADLLVPFWPRDILIPGKNGKPQNTTGKIHVSQTGTRTGLVWFSITRPKAGSIMYLQNLTALNHYCQQTETSLGEVVGGTWPELGLSLPAAKDKPLRANKEVVISEAMILFSSEVPESEPELIRQYLNMLARLYLDLSRPETMYNEWPEITEKGLKDLIDNPGCWSHKDGHSYFNAYVSDYTTPPEIMVQLAVMLPLLDYVGWSGKKLDVINIIKDGLPSFYDKDLKTIKRWLPAAENLLKEGEEQKKPDVMDSWYLHHPLLNLSRMALNGDKEARQLFLDSIDYAIKVAHRFKYKWPVFYKLSTLEVVKAETEPGKGGEKDVAGIYAHVMLQAYELTGEKRFLIEAETAAKTLAGKGFELFYQANNTVFSAGALLRLSKITGNSSYLDLSYLSLANVFVNVQLWDCDYGNGKHFPYFFALYPLSNAPYMAVYEEQEAFSAMHDYLQHAKDVDILPSVSLLLTEYIRYLVHRGVYYYPPMLPGEVISEEVKTGEIDRNLWIALEDIQDGWNKFGQVGQEVYGAGNAFGILARHYMKIPGHDCMIFVDYPVIDPKITKTRAHFYIPGSSSLSCRMRFWTPKNKKYPEPDVETSLQGKIRGILTKEGHWEYKVKGNQDIKMSWN